jgi:hypothetical protein
MNNLANVYAQQGEYGKAETLHTRILEIRRRVLGPEHPDTLMSMLNWQTSTTSRAITRRPRRSTAKPWRAGAACWAPRIRTRCFP